MKRRALWLLVCYPVFMYAQEKQWGNEFLHRALYGNQTMVQNSGRAIVQTADGFLWIATQAGLVRYDGAQFTIFNKKNTPAIHHDDITALEQSHDGSLWIGTYNGITHLHGHEFTYVPIASGVVRALKEDHAGNLWIGTMYAGVQILYKDSSHAVSYNNMEIPCRFITAIAEDPCSRIWIGTIQGIDVILPRGNHDRTINTKLSNTYIRCIAITHDSSVWVGMLSGGAIRWKNGSLQRLTSADGLPEENISTIYEDHEHTIWFGSQGKGVYRRFPNGTHRNYSIASGLTGNDVVALCEDHEGSMYVGTYSNGITQLWKGSIRNITEEEGLPGKFGLAILQKHDGSMLYAILGYGLVQIQDHTLNVFGEQKGVIDNIRTMAEDPSGTVWLGTSVGLLQMDKTGIHRLKASERFSSNVIYRVAIGTHGDVWAGTMDGNIYRWNNGQWQNFKAQGLTVNVVRALFVDSRGRLWAGGNDKLLCWNNGIIETYTTSQGLPSEPIYTITEDQSHVLWMGSYGGGLVRWKEGKFSIANHSQGLYDDIVYGMVEDDDDNMWMAGLRGISSVPKSMLNDCMDGKILAITPQVYNASDGMISSECAGNVSPSVCKHSDGTLWFSTVGGIVIVDPKHIGRNTMMPPVCIECVKFGNESIENPQEGITLPVGKRQVDFYYAAMSFLVPEMVQYRYILEGFDSTWTNAGTRHGAFYTNLPPGTYTFRVTGCNNDGLYNTTPAAFVITVPAYWYETLVFKFIVVFGLMMILLGYYRFNLQREKRLQQRVSEADEHLKVLSGLLPICSVCKKIRDDKGYWNLLEKYINDHSEARFSHGICPDCKEKLYGDYLRRLPKQRTEPPKDQTNP